MEPRQIRDTICRMIRSNEKEQFIVEMINEHSIILDEEPVLSDGSTMLHVATRQGMTNIVRTLCKHNFDRNAQDNLGNTALHYAFKYGF